MTQTQTVSQQENFEFFEKAIPFRSHTLRPARIVPVQSTRITVKANPRHLARARYEKQSSWDTIATLFYLEIIRTVTEGRIPFDVALRGLELATDDLLDQRAEESLSWSTTCRKTFGNRNEAGIEFDFE